MGYRRHDAPTPLLIGYDPYVDLPNDHLARLVEMVVNESVRPTQSPLVPGQPAFDPRLCIKVLIYGYATGVRSSRQLEKHCHESLPYLLLTRGDSPSYRTLCSARSGYGELLEKAWTSLFVVASELGMRRLGRVVVDSSKLRANASPEMVIERDEYARIKSALREILAEAQSVDAREDVEGYEGETKTGVVVDKCQMRDIVRKLRASLRKQESSKSEAESAKPMLTSRMVERVKGAIVAIDEAESDGRKHLCLTDPDARMMQGGREKRVRECHSFEVVVDRDCGLLVADGVTQVGNDNDRLEPLVEAARSNEPCGVRSVDGDSGYFKADPVSRLASGGIDLCIPDSTTACELHKGLAVGSLRRRCSLSFEYDEEHDTYCCPHGNILSCRWSKGETGMVQKLYQACGSCMGCASYSECIVRQDGKQAKSKHKCFLYRERGADLEALLARFNESEHRERYNKRGSFVETIFGFIRGTLGYDQWLLRGTDKVKSEGKLIALGYQFRKVALNWSGA